MSLAPSTGRHPGTLDPAENRRDGVSMSGFLRSDLDELDVYVTRIADTTDIPTSHIEKDYWVTEVLRVVAASSRGPARTRRQVGSSPPAATRVTIPGGPPPPRTTTASTDSGTATSSPNSLILGLDVLSREVCEHSRAASLPDDAVS